MQFGPLKETRVVIMLSVYYLGFYILVHNYIFIKICRFLLPDLFMSLAKIIIESVYIDSNL